MIYDLWSLWIKKSTSTSALALALKWNETRGKGRARDWKNILCFMALKDLLEGSCDVDITKSQQIKPEIPQRVEFSARYMRGISTF